ncbi:MAG: hypothetical protein LBC72_05735 [Spirochaetaceae bacterium]|jgi:hypothetical protein|nr:hypothetical protein [Spirochaetaceae bacterium]
MLRTLFFRTKYPAAVFALWYAAAVLGSCAQIKDPSGMSPPEDTIPPPAPSSTPEVIFEGDQAVTISWNNVFEAFSYEVAAIPEADVSSITDFSAVAPSQNLILGLEGGKVSGTVKGLTNDIPYFFYVRSVKQNGVVSKWTPPCRGTAHFRGAIILDANNTEKGSFLALADAFTWLDTYGATQSPNTHFTVIISTDGTSTNTELNYSVFSLTITSDGRRLAPLDASKSIFTVTAGNVSFKKIELAGSADASALTVTNSANVTLDTGAHISGGLQGVAFVPVLDKTPVLTVKGTSATVGGITQSAAKISGCGDGIAITSGAQVVITGDSVLEGNTNRAVFVEDGTLTAGGSARIAAAGSGRTAVAITAGTFTLEESALIRATGGAVAVKLDSYPDPAMPEAAMTGGEISGGVDIQKGTFTMEGGVISAGGVDIANEADAHFKIGDDARVTTGVTGNAVRLPQGKTVVLISAPTHGGVAEIAPAASWDADNFYQTGTTVLTAEGEVTLGEPGYYNLRFSVTKKAGDSQMWQVDDDGKLAQVTAYYVATAAGGGAAGNTGLSTGAPFLTLSQALAVAHAGATIYIKGVLTQAENAGAGASGTTSAFFIGGNAQVTLEGIGDASGFDGGGLTALELSGNANVTFKNIKLTGASGIYAAKELVAGGNAKCLTAGNSPALTVSGGLFYDSAASQTLNGISAGSLTIQSGTPTFGTNLALTSVTLAGGTYTGTMPESVTSLTVSGGAYAFNSSISVANITVTGGVLSMAADQTLTGAFAISGGTYTLNGEHAGTVTVNGGTFAMAGVDAKVSDGVVVLAAGKTITSTVSGTVSPRAVIRPASYGGLVSGSTQALTGTTDTNNYFAVEDAPDGSCWYIDNLGMFCNYAALTPASSAFFVKAGGNDNNTGISEDDAFKTLNRAVRVAAAHGTVKTVKVAGELGGTFNEGGLTDPGNGNPREETIAGGGIGSNSQTEKSLFYIADTGQTLITIEGTSSAKLKSQYPYRALKVSGNVNLLLKNITLEGGSTFDGGVLHFSGGIGQPVLKLQDVVITGGSSSTGGGVFLQQGKLYLQGTTKIHGNAGYNVYGGGVYINGGELIMEGDSSIEDNGRESGDAAGHGLGVYIHNLGTLTMNGGKIYQNTRDSGGNTSKSGLYIASGGTATINYPASVSGNDNNAYGNIYVADGGLLTLNGAVAEAGTGKYDVYLEPNGTFRVKALALTGWDGVYLAAGAKITVSEALNPTGNTFQVSSGDLLYGNASFGGYTTAATTAIAIKNAVTKTAGTQLVNNSGGDGVFTHIGLDTTNFFGQTLSTDGQLVDP